MRILKKIKGKINEHTLWEGGSQFSTAMGFFPASSFLSSSGRRTENLKPNLQEEGFG
jgi:hypothetical protein